MRKQQGFSAVEMLVVLALAALLLAAVPSMSGLLKSQRQSSAARQMVTDIRDARAKAITTGWQFRFVVYKSTASGPYKNQYRIMGRRAGSVAWPNIGDPEIDDGDQYLGPWRRFNIDYPGVEIDPSGASDSITVTFNSRGVPNSAQSFQVAAYEQSDVSITLSPTGSVAAHSY